MSIYMNPLTDFAFKKIFGEPSNKEILIDFLNTVLKENKKVITDLALLGNEHLGISKDNRAAIFDLYCTTDNEEHIIVEIQRSTQLFYKDRTVYYSSFLIQKQGEKGSKWNYEMAPVYIVSLLDFNFETEYQNNFSYYHKVKLTDIASGEIFYDKLTFIYLELPKFKKEIEELESHFDKWVYLFRNMEGLRTIPNQLNEYIFMKLLEKSKKSNLKPFELTEYETTLKTYRDNQNTMEYTIQMGIKKGIAKEVEQAVEKAVEKAVEQAVEKAVEKATAQALEDGKNKKAMETAKISIQEGLPISLISKLTGLTEKEILELM